MTRVLDELESALSVWPFDQDQLRFVRDATKGIDELRARKLVSLLLEAENSVRDCAQFLAKDTKFEPERTQLASPSARERPKYWRFRPLHDRIVVKPIDDIMMSSGGIVIPDTAQEKPMQGEVMAVGPGGRDETGKLIPVDVKEGDVVLFGRWSGTEIKIDGTELLIMKESDILAIIDGQPSWLTRKIA